MRVRPTVLVLAVIAALSVVPVAHGGTIAYGSDIQIGNQTYTGSLGLDFNVDSPIDIIRLGVFDSGGDGIAGTLSVAIFDRNTQSVVGPQLNFSSFLPGLLIGGYRFQDLETSLTLDAGQYSVVAWGFGVSDRNGNVGCNGLNVTTCTGDSITGPLMDDGGGLISFVGPNRFGATAGAYPATLETDSLSNRYLAGTFEFNAVPEPGTLGVAGLLLVALGIWRRRR
jgi:PEP-CTERM motif